MSPQEKLSLTKRRAIMYDNLVTCVAPHNDGLPHKFSDMADCVLHIEAVHHKEVTMTQIAASLKEIERKLDARPKS